LLLTWNSTLHKKIDQPFITGTGVTTYCVHPGLVATELGRYMYKEDEPPSLSRRIIHALAKTPAQGAQTSIYCAVSERVAQQSGWYYR
jgi:retinol dehydrogenase-12